MKRRMVLMSTFTVVLVLTLFTTPGFSQTSPSTALAKLQADAGGEIEYVWNSRTDTPSFVRGAIPLGAPGVRRTQAAGPASFEFIARYRDLFGVTDASQELVVAESRRDSLGLQHVTLNQVVQGVDVYGGGIKVHIGADGRNVVAVSSSFVPGVTLAQAEPSVSQAQAVVQARQALPDGVLSASPDLVAYPDRTGRASAAQLVWLVELRDDTVPVRNVYVVDAVSGGVLDVLDHLYVERVRETYDAESGYTLPGTLARSEGDEPIGDRDIDDAHDFAGATYDYYSGTHERDSYDDEGAQLISTAHYGNNYMNAFWNGQQTVYGDGFAVRDVVAHELTHAVTEHSAALEYRWQSGALNESFSDIFGAMVDRDDWLIGEDLPDSVLSGREAIRDMADPARFGQPAHTDDWVSTCSDNEGVHINNGIPNHAYYLIATAIGKDKAERIFYRTLTVYLDSTASLEDARAAALQSAADLYGDGGAEYNGVLDGFNAVGLDGVWEPEPNDCTCAASVALSAKTEPASALEVAATLYRVRDLLLTGKAGDRYQSLYELNTGRISGLLLGDAALRAEGADVLQQVAPGLAYLTDESGGEVVVTQQTVDEAVTFLEALAEEDRREGDGQLADTIEQEMARIDWDRLVGMSYDEAWAYIQSLEYSYLLTLPVIMK